MEHGGHRQRMRERFGKEGLGGFAEHEILELMLFYAIPQKNVNPIAHSLLERFGSLYGVLNASPEQLARVDGIGEYAATYLSLYAQVARRAELSRAAEKPKLSNRRTAADYCLNLLDHEKREMFYAICLNGQMEVLAAVLIAQGSLSNVAAYPRIVADAALTHNAHALLLCHNHPGGTAAPSQADLDSTDALAQMLSALEVVLVDHIIVAGGKAMSMVRNGLIEQSVRPAGGVDTRVASSAGETRLAYRLKTDGKLTTEDV